MNEQHLFIGSPRLQAGWDPSEATPALTKWPPSVMPTSYTVGEAKDGSVLTVEIHLPGVTAAEQVSLDVTACQIVVVSPTCARVEVDLPRVVMPEQVTARFKRRTSLLRLELPVSVPVPGLLSGETFISAPVLTAAARPNAVPALSKQEGQRRPALVPEYGPEPEPEPDLEPDSLTKLLGSMGLSHFGHGAKAVDGPTAVPAYAPATFVEGKCGVFHPDFAAAAAKMDPVLRRVLVDDVVDEDDRALLELLGNGPNRLTATRALLRKKRAIQSAGCAALCAAVDSERNMESDSVDNKAQHQLNITIDRLIKLIGRKDVDGLWQLADDLLALQRVEAEALAEETGVQVSDELAEKIEVAKGGYKVDMFVRRYTRETRPWIPFHYDNSNLTINIALSPDSGHEGGRLHAIIDGRHHAIVREEGEATVHGDDVLHAVSAMASGVRHSLIMFFFALQDSEEAREHETLPGASAN